MAHILLECFESHILFLIFFFWVGILPCSRGWTWMQNSISVSKELGLQLWSPYLAFHLFIFGMCVHMQMCIRLSAKCVSMWRPTLYLEALTYDRATPFKPHLHTYMYIFLKTSTIVDFCTSFLVGCNLTNNYTEAYY